MPLLINCHPVFMYLLLFSVQHNITKTPIQFSSFRSSPEYELMSFIQEEPVNTISKGATHTSEHETPQQTNFREAEEKTFFCMCALQYSHTNGISVSTQSSYKALECLSHCEFYNFPWEHVITSNASHLVDSQ